MVRRLRPLAVKMVSRYPVPKNKQCIEEEDRVQESLILFSQKYNPELSSPEEFLFFCVKRVCLTDKRDARLVVESTEKDVSAAGGGNRDEWVYLKGVLPYLRPSELRAILVQIETGSWTEGAELAKASKQALQKGVLSIAALCKLYEKGGAALVARKRKLDVSLEAVSLRSRILSQLG